MHHNENEDKSAEPESELLSTLNKKTANPDPRVFIDWFFWTDTNGSKQLSDQGIALLSKIHEEEEGCDYQPLFCEGESAMQHVVNELLKTPIGTEVVLVCDNIYTNKKTQIERTSHRYAIKLIHTSEGYTEIKVDSRRNYITISDENNIFLGKTQNDTFSCGVYAAKAAYKLLKIQGTATLKRSLDEFKKSTQSATVFIGKEAWRKQHRKHRKIATIEKESKESKESNTINDYAQYFAKKQCEQVLEWLEQHTEKEAVAAVKKFDAMSITSRDLAARYVERQEKYPEIFSRKVRSHIQKGKNPNRLNTLGETLLHEAVRLNDDISVQSLLKAGANPLPILAWQDLDPKLIDLIKNYSNPENPNLPDSQSGILPLMKTLLDLKDMQTLGLEEKTEKTLNEIQNMIKMGANPYLPDDSQNGKSPLMQAVCNVNLPIEMIVELVGKGGNSLNQADYNGWTPLHWAISHGNIEAAKYLLKKGANPNLQSQNEETPLSLAATYNANKALKDDMVHLLLTSRADSFIMKNALIKTPNNKTFSYLKLTCVLPATNENEDDTQLQEKLCDIVNTNDTLSFIRAAANYVYAEVILKQKNSHLLEFFLLAKFYEKLKPLLNSSEDSSKSWEHAIDKSFQLLITSSPTQQPFQAIFNLLTAGKINKKFIQEFKTDIQNAIEIAIDTDSTDMAEYLKKVLDELNNILTSSTQTHHNLFQPKQETSHENESKDELPPKSNLTP